MNIEETSMAQALLDAGSAVGHVHFVDSNRQAAGLGHMDFRPIATALQQLSWHGYASAEAFPLPDSQSAAEHTIRTWMQLFGTQSA
jgi:sugar phosphate isomerase/epimerase